MDTIAILLNVSNNSFEEVKSYLIGVQFSRRRPSPLSPPPSEKEGGNAPVRSAKDIMTSNELENKEYNIV